MAARAPVQNASPGKALAGFLLSGFLFAFLGAILPVWGYHLKSEFITVGYYFLSLGLGVVASNEVARRLSPKRLSSLLVFACAMACVGLLCLALASPPVLPVWRMGGLILIGFDAGVLNTALFHAVSPVYQHDPASTANRGGIFFGLGCLTATLLVGGTFYAYTAPSILTLVAVVPGLFALVYARTKFPAPAAWPRQPLRDFRSAAAILFALLVFFQFGNEWSIAGWLPLFLIHRLGISPQSSLWLLALFWLSLLAGRVAALGVLPRVRHGKLLMGSALTALFGCTILLFTNNVFGASTGILLVGSGFACVYPLVAETIGRRFPDYQPGFFNGIFSLALMGGMLAPWTLGYAAQAWGIQVVMALPFLGTCMVFALLLLSWLEAKLTG